MTTEQIRERAEELAHQIMEFVEDENPEAAVHALSSILGILIFQNTGSQSEATWKVGVISTNISRIARDNHQQFTEKAGM